MKVIAYNGSPRRNGNTALLLESALRGAASSGADTSLVNLYSLDYKGCTSCFACKRIGGKSYGACAMRDGLTPVLEEFREADVAVFGSPIYFWDITGQMRCFLERLWYPYLMYTKAPDRSLFKKSIKTLFVYTCNVGEEMLKKMNMYEILSGNEQRSKMLFRGESSSYYCTDTLQFGDYSKYVSDMFDAEAKLKRREEVFPHQLEEMFEMGKKLVL